MCILWLKDSPPYDKRAFLIKIDFPIDFPFKPPIILFITAIYHPNINEKGEVCLPIIAPEHWNPSNKITEVMQALVAVVNDPDPNTAIRDEVATQLIEHKEKFMKIAAEHTLKYGLKRPRD